MTRFAIDAATALRIVLEDRTVRPEHALVGPVVLRSHVLSSLYRQTRAGQLDEKAARAALDRLATMKIRLLGDRVSRATAFRIAGSLDGEDTALAEYLAVATLQADVLVTDDRELRRAAEGLIAVDGYDALWR
ncbi:hypothetical protein [Microbacterium lacus]|uniref:PIN domain-containing protein n=1 Tax=Microbacterium lacus TaxID=415217 RepID=A0ABN2GS36_9MICO